MLVVLVYAVPLGELGAEGKYHGREGGRMGGWKDGREGEGEGG